MRRQTLVHLDFFGDKSAYCLLGADMLLRQIVTLENQIDGVRKNDDIEFMHKLRVTSRRMRAALSLFGECFLRKSSKKWINAIRNVTRSSGAARDADVQLVFLENYSRTVEDRSALPGLAYLTTLQRARRVGMQSDIVSVLDALEGSNILADISDSSMTLLRNLREQNRSEPVIKTPSNYEKARDHISSRLDDVLALEQFVHDESAAVKHHELRIATKRLRYTMEIFSPLYKGELKEQISLMKQLQDVLGEIHDYVVWVQEFSVYLQGVPDDARYGVSKVLSHAAEMKKSRYKDFVTLWDNAVAKALFDNIRQVTETGPSSEVVREILNHDNPPVAVISDVHGNLDAFKAVVVDARRSGIDVFLNAGDAVGFGTYPKQVIRALRSAMFLNVIGNVDLEVLEKGLQNPRAEKNSIMQFTFRELAPSDLAYLHSLPKELRLEICGKKILLTHGTPDSINEHIYPNTPSKRLKEIASKANAEVIITGHSHIQMNRNVGGVTFVNPGSVGRPADGDYRAEYAIVRFNPFSLEFRRVNYDVEATANEIRRRGLPESLAQVLLRGVSLDTVKELDDALEKKQLWKRRSTISKVRRIAKRFISDNSHAEQSRKLALVIFDKTRRLHSMSRKERYWLECAAILHDIGLSRGNRGYHKSSLRLILNDLEFPFTFRDRYMIGSVARYHRKAMPDANHFNLAQLSGVERQEVVVLSSILRVAEALDCSSEFIVRKIAVRVLPNQMVLECEATGDIYTGDQAFKKMKNLLEKTFGRDLIIVWKTRQTRRKRHPALQAHRDRAVRSRTRTRQPS
ncbi:MAG: YfcE family phosphodiesterase [Candidatus Bathyarchaeia archaeon]|jgi:putative phosphoesterase